MCSPTPHLPNLLPTLSLHTSSPGPEVFGRKVGKIHATHTLNGGSQRPRPDTSPLLWCRVLRTAHHALLRPLDGGLSLCVPR